MYLKCSNKPLPVTLLIFLLMLFSQLPPGFGLSGNNNIKRIGSDWPQWRGSNRDGVSSVTGISTDWSNDEARTLWRIPVGEGYSGISVLKNKIYTMWDEGSSQYLFCLDASNGKEIWQFKIGENFTSHYGNGPRSTPVVDGDLVYAISTRGLLYAVDIVSGEQRWSHDLAVEYGSRIPSIGYSSSPLINGDQFFAEVGGKEDFAFVSFNKKTGDLLWHSQSDFPAYSSPIIAKVMGKKQVVFLSAKGLFAVSPESGNALWEFSWETRCPSTDIPLNTATPIFIAPDKFFISSGYGTVSGGAVVRIEASDGKFSAESVWTNDKMQNLINSSVLVENHIYGFDSSILKCVDTATGAEKWKARGFERGSLIAADGYLIVLGERGKLGLIKATPHGFVEVTSAQVLDGKCWTSPTLANGTLFLRNQKEMVCFDIQ